MSRRHYDLPPFATLGAFEAAARHQSFKNAAQELSVTPGAVSHQIKALEGELGIALFMRQHRAVELTPEGKELYDTLVTSFGDISRRLAKLKQLRSADTVTVGSTTAVAAFWLSPAIISFWRDHPDVNVHQITQDHPFGSSQSLDLYITYGKPQDPALQYDAIYRDELVAVANPELAHDLKECSLDSLASQRLIHLEANNSSWTRWSEWFRTLGYHGDLAQGSTVTSYSVALQIAQQGAGIALGWKQLIKPLIDSGKLASIGGFKTPAPHQFYLAGLPDTELSPNALALKKWILPNFE